MSRLIVRDTGGGDFNPVPQGTHLAVCNLVADVGLQAAGRFAPRPKIYLRWELVHERVTWNDRDGKPHEGPAQIGKFYTASLATKATLRKDLENWRGRAFTAAELEGFDVLAVLGHACQLVVTHTRGADGRTYANVAGLVGLPRNMDRPKAERPLVKYTADDPSQFEQLPGWLAERIREAQAAPPAETISGPELAPYDDDIPFAWAALVPWLLVAASALPELARVV